MRPAAGDNAAACGGTGRGGRRGLRAISDPGRDAAGLGGSGGTRSGDGYDRLVSPPRAVKDIPHDTADASAGLPIHPELTGFDYELIANNLRVNLCRAYEDFIASRGHSGVDRGAYCHGGSIDRERGRLASVAARIGPTPLICVDAIVLDVETTGLDPRTARVVQIGAVALEGQGGAPNEFSILVNPGTSVPASATAIHGIADRDLRDAADPRGALAELFRFLDGRPVMAIRSVSTSPCSAPRRAGSAWRRLRVRVARHPTLARSSLATRPISPWRRSARGCRRSYLRVVTPHSVMRATARIFQKLLPGTAGEGHTNLAEAVAASRNLNQAPAPIEAQPRRSRESWRRKSPFARIDAYPYRHRVREVMTSPAGVPRTLRRSARRSG